MLTVTEYPPNVTQPEPNHHADGGHWIIQDDEDVCFTDHYNIFLEIDDKMPMVDDEFWKGNNISTCVRHVAIYPFTFLVWKESPGHMLEVCLLSWYETGLVMHYCCGDILVINGNITLEPSLVRFTSWIRNQRLLCRQKRRSNQFRLFALFTVAYS